MMNKNYFRNGIDVSWGDGSTTLFFAPVNGRFELLDYEFDTKKIHEMGGGRKCYESQSGLTGAGYLTNYGELIPVGLYRVDTRYNNFQYAEEVAEGIRIMVPYMAHEKNKKAILKEYPVVIIKGSTIIYCDFYNNMNEVLETLLTDGKLQKEPRVLTRNFFSPSGKTTWGKNIVEEIKFYNFFAKTYPWPWGFAKEMLESYQVYEPVERIHQILHIAKCESGEWVKTSRIEGKLYATQELKGDPCVKMKEAPKGWELADTNMVYKFYKDKVYIVGWQLADVAYQKKAQRLARFIPDAEAREFTNYIEDNCPDVKYVEFELEVPKLLFFLDKEKQFTIVRKGIAKKVKEDVLAAARKYMDNFNDQQVLEAIPDDFVIHFNDSLDSGNCRPGTQEFVDKYFPEKMETTAKELKQYAHNFNVIRVLRYVAKREKIAGKIKLEIPV